MKKKYQTKAFKVLVKREVKDKAFNELDAIKAEQKYINLTSFMNQQMYLVSDQQDNKAEQIYSILELTIFSKCLITIIVHGWKRFRQSNSALVIRDDSTALH